ncbi:hypothetical protein D3C76_1421150 [compost metagenome]
MPGSSLISGTVPGGANWANSAVTAPSGNSSTSRFSTGMRRHASRVRVMTATAIRLAALKKSRLRPSGVISWKNRAPLWAITARAPSKPSSRLSDLRPWARCEPW